MSRRGKRKDEEDFASNGDSDGGGAPAKKNARKGSDDFGNIVVCDLSKNRRVRVRNWQGKIVVDIREFYSKDGKEMPGKKVITPEKGESSMASTMEEEESHHLLAMQMTSASVLPMVLRATLELHIFDILAEAGPGTCLSPEDIASRLPTRNPDAPRLLDCMLRLLVSNSLLTCTVLSHDHRVYGLAPVSKLFVKNKDGGSLAPYLLMIQDHAYINSWYHLKESILEGGGLPFYKAHGENSMDYIGKDPKLIEGMRNLMFEFNVLFMKKFLNTYKGFEGLRVLVDVGGGTGQILSIILSKYPSIKGINFDLPHVIERASPCSGVQHVGGDMLTSIPKGDAIFMKLVIHLWSDEHCLKLLRNCYEALSDYGKVIVVDLIAPTSPETTVAAKSILQTEMFITTTNHRAKERTIEEFTALAREAGFVSVSVACCAYTFSVMEFYK